MRFVERLKLAGQVITGRVRAPERLTDIYPRLMQLGQQRMSGKQPAFKPTPRNIRYFSRTPYARRAINAIKNPIAMAEWEVRPRRGVKISDELKRQIEVVRTCLERPNEDDSFRSLVEQVIEDYLAGAGAIEQEIGTDPARPLWLWPVDGLSIQIYPAWEGNQDEARYLQVIGYGSPSGAHQGVQLRNEELIYIRPNPTTADPFGYGPLEVAFMSISRILGVGAYAGKVASNAIPNVWLDLGEGADTNALDAFRVYWQNEIEGQGKLPITGGSKGAQVNRLWPEGDSALYLKYQEFLKSEIAVAFDLSPQNLGVERDVNRSTAEVAEERDIRQAIRPAADAISASISREAIQGRLGFSQLELHFLGFETDDELNDAEVFDKEYKANAATPNEYRERKGWPKLKSQWGDMTYADAEIAIAAARGTAMLEDTALPRSAQTPLGTPLTQPKGSAKDKPDPENGPPGNRKRPARRAPSGE